jgi:predicted deacylase
VILTLLVVLQAQTAPLTVGRITAQPGEIASGWLDVRAAADSGTRIPFTILRGRRSGPTLALVAGTHGSEVAPIVALQRVLRGGEIDPARLRGTILLVHVANMPSFQKRTVYYSPIDGKNLNRMYPGRAAGTVSERIADVITREIITRADYLVDMHAGDGNEALLPYTYWGKLGLDARVDSVAREMALAWGNEQIVVDTARPRDPRASFYTQNTAHLMGKPALTTEGGQLGIPAEEYVQRNVRGVLRLLRYLRMIDGPVEMVENPVWFERTEVLRSGHTGTWHAAVQPGQTVAAGALLGRITDFFGNQLAEIRAPFAGRMLYVVATPAISVGEPLGMVGEPKP